MVLIVYEIGENVDVGGHKTRALFQRHFMEAKLDPGRYYSVVLGNAEIHVMADVCPEPVPGKEPLPAKVFSIKDCDDEDLIGELERRLYYRL